MRSFWLESHEIIIFFNKRQQKPALYIAHTKRARNFLETLKFAKEIHLINIQHIILDTFIPYRTFWPFSNYFAISIFILFRSKILTPRLNPRFMMMRTRQTFLKQNKARPQCALKVRKKYNLGKPQRPVYNQL